MTREGPTMASERVTKILEFRQAPFTRAELEAMTERDAWRWLYRHFPPKTRRKGSSSDPSIPAVVLSGMPEETRPDLREYARACGFRVLGSMSPGVRYLVVGDAPGPVKMQYASEHKVPVIPVLEFLENAEDLYARAAGPAGAAPSASAGQESAARGPGPDRAADAGSLPGTPPP